MLFQVLQKLVQICLLAKVTTKPKPITQEDQDHLQYSAMEAPMKISLLHKKLGLWLEWQPELNKRINQAGQLLKLE